MIPTVGRIVQYALTEQDAAEINRRRQDARNSMGKHLADRDGSVIHAGNPVNAGETYPLVITRVWGEHATSAVNGQVLLDGADTLWVTSVTAGAGKRQFRWPQTAERQHSTCPCSMRIG